MCGQSCVRPAEAVPHLKATRYRKTLDSPPVTDILRGSTVKPESSSHRRTAYAIPNRPAHLRQKRVEGGRQRRRPRQDHPRRPAAGVGALPARLGRRRAARPRRRARAARPPRPAARARPPPHAYQINVYDKARSKDDEDYLGYHYSPNGYPVTSIFAKDDIAKDGNISVTLSHEVLERLVT